MLLSPVSVVEGWRTVISQLFGVYCTLYAVRRPLVVATVKFDFFAAREESSKETKDGQSKETKDGQSKEAKGWTVQGN